MGVKIISPALKLTWWHGSRRVEELWSCKSSWFTCHYRSLCSWLPGSDAWRTPGSLVDYYPAEKERIANHDYGKYSFRSCYRKAFMDALEMKFTGIIAGTVNFLTGETSFRCWFRTRLLGFSCQCWSIRLVSINLTPALWKFLQTSRIDANFPFVSMLIWVWLVGHGAMAYP